MALSIGYIGLEFGDVATILTCWLVNKQLSARNFKEELSCWSYLWVRGSKAKVLTISCSV
jgi:hypothetical protein